MPMQRAQDAVVSEFGDRNASGRGVSEMSKLEENVTPHVRDSDVAEEGGIGLTEILEI